MRRPEQGYIWWAVWAISVILCTGGMALVTLKNDVSLTGTVIGIGGAVLAIWLGVTKK